MSVKFKSFRKSRLQAGFLSDVQIHGDADKLMSRAHASRRNGSFQHISHCLAIPYPHTQTIEGQPMFLSDYMTPRQRIPQSLEHDANKMAINRDFDSRETNLDDGDIAIPATGKIVLG